MSATHTDPAAPSVAQGRDPVAIRWTYGGSPLGWADGETVSVGPAPDTVDAGCPPGVVPADEEHPVMSRAQAPTRTAARKDFTDLAAGMSGR